MVVRHRVRLRDDPAEYEYILGFPEWFFYSCIAGYVGISLILWGAVRLFFKDLRSTTRTNRRTRAMVNHVAMIVPLVLYFVLIMGIAWLGNRFAAKRATPRASWRNISSAAVRWAASSSRWRS